MKLNTFYMTIIFSVVAVQIEGKSSKRSPFYAMELFVLITTAEIIASANC